MAEPSTEPTIGVLVERMTTMLDKITAVQTTVTGLDCRFDDFERKEIERHTQLGADIKGHETQLADHAKRIKDLEKLMQPLVVYAKILSVIGSALGVAIIALIWALITGQAQVVFP